MKQVSWCTGKYFIQFPGYILLTQQGQEMALCGWDMHYGRSLLAVQEEGLRRGVVLMTPVSAQANF
jgi:hypothetical protein